MTQEEQAKAVEQTLCDHSNQETDWQRRIITCKDCRKPLPWSYSGIAFGQTASATNIDAVAIGRSATCVAKKGL